MPLQHDAFERSASARAAVRNQLMGTGHSLESRPEEHVGLVSIRTHRWYRKFQCEFKVCTVQMMIAR